MQGRRIPPPSHFVGTTGALASVGGRRAPLDRIVIHADSGIGVSGFQIAERKRDRLGRQNWCFFQVECAVCRQRNIEVLFSLLPRGNDHRESRDGQTQGRATATGEQGDQKEGEQM